MSFKMLVLFLVCSAIIFYETMAKKCENISPDAVTQLDNGTIAAFEGNKVWLFTPLGREMVGPCTISSVFNGMDGPVEAAVTIMDILEPREYIGASIFFTKNDFFTFKNLRPYQVESGNLIVMPFKGRKKLMGAGDVARNLMPTQMSAAFFDPVSHERAQYGMGKIMFPKGDILGLPFDMYSDWTTFVPEYSNTTAFLKSYGISSTMEDEVTAAVTLKTSKRIVLFMGSKYCSISYEDKVGPRSVQKCVVEPITKFFDCPGVNYVKNGCGGKTMFANPDDPDSDNSVTTDKGGPDSAEPEANNAGVVTTVPTKSQSKGGSPSSGAEHNVFSLLMISFYYLLMNR